MLHLRGAFEPEKNALIFSGMTKNWSTSLPPDRLLNLPEHDAKTLAQKLRVTVQQSPQKAGEAESSFLNALTGHQALRVLGQRMDVAIIP